MSLKDNRGQLTKWKAGYGFIRFENRDVFVHRTHYNSGFKPEIGQIVQFDFALSPDQDKPPMAVNVRVSKSAGAVAADEEVKKRLREELAKFDLEQGRTSGQDGAA